ncbi:MAG: glycoside hydrolase family 3 N-terminal domain-containing protein [Tannerellaceae bacterium]
MKKTFLFTTVVLLFCSCNSSGVKDNSISYDKEIELLIEQKMKDMTLQEKVGQMTQLTLDVVTQGDGIYSTNFPVQLDDALVDSVIGKYKVGSILNVPSGVPLSVEDWSYVITGLQKAALKETGIPIIYGVDQIHGTTYTIGGTLFPQQIGMGATFNRDLVKIGAQITAYETKAGNIPWTFSPVLDLGRDARWPRMWETYGEDVFLTSELGKAAVIGYQGDDPNHIGNNNIASCLKHFMGYGAPFSGKDRTPSYISDQDMREKHFQPFLEAIRAGALSVMVNSAMNNGLPLHANYELMTTWLKDDLNWDGVIVTDWADINNLCTRDRVAKDKKEAIKIAVNAGVDMSMVPYEWSYCSMLKELVEEGEISMQRIDDAVRRVLRMKARLNLFNKPYWNSSEYPNFGSKQHAEIALRSAEESITLLKNENELLPISNGKRILVCGPNANSMRALNGGWSMSWQGDMADKYCSDRNTILESLQNKFGKENVVYSPGVIYTNDWYGAENADGINAAVLAARNVDYIVLCIGENSYCETPGNLSDLTLSENQIRLCKELSQIGKPIIMILNEGRPRIISSIESLAHSILHIYLPGNYGGDALANVLSGEVNPSGKLPFTYPKNVNSLITYDHKPCENTGTMEGAYNYNALTDIQFGFGFGLSYTSFEYSDLRTDKASFNYADTLMISVSVKNTGSVVGKESVLLFINDDIASLTPDVRRLRGFEKIELQPDESKTVTFYVLAKDLAFVGYDKHWILEEGDFTIQIGSQVEKINCNSEYKWITSNR